MELIRNSSVYDLTVVPELRGILERNEACNNNVLNVLESNTNGQNYRVIRYNKSILSLETIPTYGLCRSLVINSNNKLIGFAPPKSTCAETFMKTYVNKTHAEEFVEGTMINVFWNESWEISTRSKVGGETRFFKATEGKTFRVLFQEACVKCHLDITTLNKELCYSFVLQHPENRIVVPFTSAELYLVAVYRIDTSNLIIQSFDMTCVSNFLSYLGLENTAIKFPNVYKYDTYEELIDKYASINTPYDVVGVVLYNHLTGERAKVRNPVYEQVKQLRGNQPKIQYQYLSLRKDGKLNEFLKYFPEYKKEFLQFRAEVHLFTTTLYTNYVSCYIKKEKPLAEFLSQHRTHMFHLHQLYLIKRERVTNSVAIQYVNNLHPSLLMFSLNYHLRTH